MVEDVLIIVTVTLVYWIVGFVARAENFIIFLCLFFVFTLMMMTLFGFLASFAPNKSVYLAAATVTIFANSTYYMFHCICISLPLLVLSHSIWGYILFYRSGLFGVYCQPNCLSSLLVLVVLVHPFFMVLQSHGNQPTCQPRLSW